MGTVWMIWSLLVAMLVQQQRAADSSKSIHKATRSLVRIVMVYPLVPDIPLQICTGVLMTLDQVLVPPDCVLPVLKTDNIWICAGTVESDRECMLAMRGKSPTKTVQMRRVSRVVPFLARQRCHPEASAMLFTVKEFKETSVTIPMTFQKLGYPAGQVIQFNNDCVAVGWPKVDPTNWEQNIKPKTFKTAISGNQATCFAVYNESQPPHLQICAIDCHWNTVMVHLLNDSYQKMADDIFLVCLDKVVTIPLSHTAK